MAQFTGGKVQMLFRLLGPVRIAGATEMQSSTRRALLTALLLRRGQFMGMDELVELLWPAPPSSAVANLRSHLTGLRRSLDSAQPGLSKRLTTSRGADTGYALRVDADEIDLSRFLRLARQGRELLAAGQHQRAVGALGEALALWRGPFGQRLPATRWFHAHTLGLNNTRLEACQNYFAACLLTQRTEMLPYRIETVLAGAPHRQRLWQLLAASYCAQGDVPGALGVIERCRTVFAEDLGLDVPPGVEAIRAAALTWDTARAHRLVAEMARL
ncbi:AfsR/SARP family transcriptional regulator [Streptomyces xanthii]|uniref:AfsR/SARP family transcriptional regulator n=1 Tax=Streptomyces xanthii TaxID=2768069 RepID=UPI001CB78084|nr:BTAD domain-containing putative transcriptional regulator [Streptomyces xanthii]